MEKKVCFNLSLNETRFFEKDKIDYYDDYLSTIQNYLCYGNNHDNNDEKNNSLKNKEMILRNGKFINEKKNL